MDLPVFLVTDSGHPIAPDVQADDPGVRRDGEVRPRARGVQVGDGGGLASAVLHTMGRRGDTVGGRDVLVRADGQSQAGHAVDKRLLLALGDGVKAASPLHVQGALLAVELGFAVILVALDPSQDG